MTMAVQQGREDHQSGTRHAYHHDSNGGTCAGYGRLPHENLRDHVARCCATIIHEVLAHVPESLCIAEYILPPCLRLLVDRTMPHHVAHIVPQASIEWIPIREGAHK